MNFQVNNTAPALPMQQSTAGLTSPAQLPVAAASQSFTPGDALHLSVQSAPLAFPPQQKVIELNNGGLPVVQNAAPLMNVQDQNLSPYTPTLTMLNISQHDMQWATQLEAKVQQGYKPTAEETAYYQNLGTQLSMLRNNIQPLTPVQPLPQIQNWGPGPAAPTQQPQQAGLTEAQIFGPGMPPKDQQVTMSEIEWALIVEEKVQKYDYKPSPADEVKYKNILMRFQANQEIKMTFLDSLAAQSPWVGANVASIRYSKIVAGQVSDVIKAIKSGNGSVMSGLKGIGMSAVKATGLSALVSGGFSAVTNAIAYARGEKTKTQAIANVATDTVSGAAIGLGSTIVGGAAMTALAATSITGLPLTLLVGGAGILGGWLADKVLQKTGAKEWVKSKVIGWLDGGSSQPAQQAAQTQQQMPQTQAGMSGGYPQQSPQMAYGY